MEAWYHRTGLLFYIHARRLARHAMRTSLCSSPSRPISCQRSANLFTLHQSASFNLGGKLTGTRFAVWPSPPRATNLSRRTAHQTGSCGTRRPQSKRSSTVSRFSLAWSTDSELQGTGQCGRHAVTQLHTSGRCLSRNICPLFTRLQGLLLVYEGMAETS